MPSGQGLSTSQCSNQKFNIASYATDLYERFFEASTEDTDKLFQQMADYFSSSGCFSLSLPRFTDPDKEPHSFWKFMVQSAPQLSKLALHLFQIAVNSAAVERLFSAFGNIQTKRRNKFVLDRLEKLAMIKAMLPAKPRPTGKQPAGNQYLSNRSHNNEVAQAELAIATRQNDSEYADGESDLMVAGEQVEEVMEEYNTQLSEDADDDADYQPSPDSVRLAALFVNMPEFDLNLLFDEDIPA